MKIILPTSEKYWTLHSSTENLSCGLLLQRIWGWFLCSLIDLSDCRKSRTRDLMNSEKKKLQVSLPGSSPDISIFFFLYFLFLSKYLFPPSILHWTHKSETQPALTDFIRILLFFFHWKPNYYTCLKLPVSSSGQKICLSYVCLDPGNSCGKWYCS